MAAANSGAALGQLVQSLTDDLELALDCRPEHRVREVVVEGASFGEP